MVKIPYLMENCNFQSQVSPDPPLQADLGFFMPTYVRPYT